MSQLLEPTALGKNRFLTDALLPMAGAHIHEDIVFMVTGFTAHKSAKTMAVAGGMYDSLFETFERTWSALQSIKAMSNPKEDVVLEMGCADMSLYSTFKSIRAYPNYIGVDIRRDYLLNSRYKSRVDALGLCADLMEPLPIKDASIAAVVISEVVEHLTHEQNMIALKEAYRILRPGGKLLVSSPFNTRSRQFHDLKKEKNLGHVFFWDVEQFEEDMSSIGFSSVDKKWGYSISSKILAAEVKKSLSPDVAKFLEDISAMYGSRVARALTLSAPGVVNGGGRFVVTK